jgi:D-alanine-D-alanine ligase-like ATP-grasp enzyme
MPQNTAPGATGHPETPYTDSVREILADYDQPVFYFSRTVTNLVGLPRTLKNFFFVSLTDSWGGKNHHSFTPSNVPASDISGFEGSVNWLLRNTEVQEFVRAKTPDGYTPFIVAAKFDAESERLCKALGYRLIMPDVTLRKHLDSKLVTTDLGNRGGVPSVPNILTQADSWADLREQAETAGLGSDLVVQLAYGDSGATTFFISDEATWQNVSAQVRGVTIKAMKRINHYPLATEAVIMERGTVIGPTLREITGHKELTRYRGGWVGSELYPDLVTAEVHQKITEQIQRFCQELRKEGYRGILEVSTLLDTDTNEVYLGELNPRLSGSSAHSNLTIHGQTLPLFAFHALQFSGVDLSPETIEGVNEERQRALADQTWTTLVIQHNEFDHRLITQEPESGRYRITDSFELEAIGSEPDWLDLNSPDEAYLLAGAPVDSEIGIGSFLCFLMVQRRGQEEHFALTADAQRLVRASKKLFRARKQPLIHRYWRALVRRIRREYTARFTSSPGAKHSE